MLNYKKVILVSKQPLLLYTVSQSILKLLHPFRWIHTYIPILPHECEDFLDAPTPYLMGFISDNLTYDDLCEMYPYHVICDLDTSNIKADNVPKLPPNEDKIIRTKVNVHF